MINEPSIHVAFTYSMLYGESTAIPTLSQIREELGKLNRTFVVKVVLQILKQIDILNDVERFCEVFFVGNEPLKKLFIDRYSEKFKQLRNNNRETTPSLTVFSKHNCLELLKIVFSITPNDKGCVDELQCKRTLFDALLILNERITVDPECPKDLDSKIRTAYQMLLTLLSYNEYTNNSNAVDFMIQCYKANVLFDFCDANETFKTLFQLFLNSLGCSCWKEYVFALSRLFVLDSGNENNIKCEIVLDPQSASYFQDKRVLDGFAIQENDIIDDSINVDYVKFKEKPIICIENDTYYVIEPFFLASRIYKSIFWELKDKNGQLGVEKDFFRFYTTEFSERYLFYGVVQNMIKKTSCKSFSGISLEKKMSAPPDYYIRDGNDVYIFEFKDMFFRKEEKVECVYEKVKEHIEQKLVCKDNGKPSGVIQLVNCIVALKKGDYNVLDPNIKTGNVRVYPLLVVGDATFATPGMSVILNDYFRNNLRQHHMEADHLIKDLTLVSVDSLILYQDDVREKRKKLKDILSSYIRFLHVRQPYSNQDIMKNFLHEYFSLDQYLRFQGLPQSMSSVLNSVLERLEAEGNQI